MFRRRTKSPTIDLRALDPRWRRPVEQALEARSRFDALVERLKPGPTRRRLEELRPRLDAGAVASWEIATAAQAAVGAVATLEPDRITDRMKQARRRLADVPDDSADADDVRAEIDALATQLASIARLWDGIDDAAKRLDRIELRLDAAVARAAELLLSPASHDVLTQVEGDLAGAVDELESLRQAIASLTT
jgi:hypothetical protein